MTTSEFALIISAAALTVSLLSLWYNNLSPFKLMITHDTPTFTIYYITPQISGDTAGKAWWIPSFDVGFSFHNAGKISGQVLDLRIVAELKKLTFHYEIYFLSEMDCRLHVIYKLQG